MFHSALRPAAHTSAPSGTGVVQRLGFTILELMIVVTLLVAMTGLVMPSVLNRLGDSLTVASLRQIEAAASECRSKAQQDGLALRLIAKERADGSVGIYVERIEESESKLTGFGDPADSVFEDQGDTDFAMPWDERASSPVYVLPVGFAFSRALPEVDDGLFADSSANQDKIVGGARQDDDLIARSFMEDQDSPPMTLAVYLPDGTAIVERPLYLITDEQTHEIEISRWAGGIATTRIRLDDEDVFGEGGFGENDFGSGPASDNSTGRTSRSGDGR